MFVVKPPLSVTINFKNSKKEEKKKVEKNVQQIFFF